MFCNKNTFIFSILATGFFLGCSNIYGSSTSTWTGDISSDLQTSGNWDSGVPFSGIAIFDGNGANSPLSRRDGGISFEQMEFTSGTDVAVITSIQTNGSPGILADPGVTANFDIYEHQPLAYPPASMIVNNGSAGDGGGTVLYNLEAYGQLYAYAGSSGSTIINVTMTGGNNHFEVNGPGNCIFDNIASDDATDELVISSVSTLVIRGSNTNTIEGVISGDGSLIKNGSGILIFNNDNTYTGSTTINAGVLEVNGDLSGDVTVNTGGSLKGIGSINGTLQSSGTISPGNSIGTLNVVNYVSTGSSTFSCEINSAGASDQIIATGSMTVAGRLDVIPLDAGFTAPQTYTILSAASGISGTFSTIGSTLPGLISLSYATNNVFLTYLPLSAVGLSGNASAAANCFVSLSGSDANEVSTELLLLSFPEMQKAFNQMQPSQFSAQTWNQIANALLVRSSYSKHMRELSLRKNCSEYQSDFWIDPIGQWEFQHAKGDQFGYRDWTSGISIGTDTSLNQFRFGGAASYTYSHIKWDQSAGSGHINSYYGGLYTGFSNGVGYIMLSALGAYNQYHTSRHIDFGDINRRASGSHHGWETLAGIEGGAYFTTGSIRMGPFARFDYIYLWQNSYTESGAESLNLHLESRQDQLVESQFGIAFTSKYECSSDNTRGTFVPRLELSYINQTPIAKSDYEASFEESSCEFDVSGWNFERNLGAVGASITYLTPNERFGLSLQYDGEFKRHYYNQSGNLVFNVKY